MQKRPRLFRIQPALPDSSLSLCSIHSPRLAAAAATLLSALASPPASPPLPPRGSSQLSPLSFPLAVSPPLGAAASPCLGSPFHLFFFNFLLQASDESPDLASARKDMVDARTYTPDPGQHNHQMGAAAAGHLRGAAAGRRISLQHPSPLPSSWRWWTRDPKLPSTTRCCYG